MQSAELARELHDEILCAKPICVIIRAVNHAFLLDLYHAMTWPSLSYVAEDNKGRIVGYILAKM
jgi:hypothetical protein